MGIEDLIEGIKTEMERDHALRTRITPAREKMQTLVNEFTKQLATELCRAIVVQKEAENNLMSEKEKEGKIEVPIILFGLNEIEELVETIEKKLKFDFASHFELKLPEVEN